LKPFVDVGDDTIDKGTMNCYAETVRVKVAERVERNLTGHMLV
jgi:hypothetical protein